MDYEVKSLISSWAGLLLEIDRYFHHSHPPEPTILLVCGRNRELWEQPFQACAIDEDYVRPDGQNSVISFVISKWLLPELSIPAADQMDRRLWGRECISTCLHRHSGMPGYKKHNRLRMSSVLHLTDFAFFSLLYRIGSCLARAPQQKYIDFYPSISSAQTLR